MTQTISKFFSEFDGEIELHTMTREESNALLSSFPGPTTKGITPLWGIWQFKRVKNISSLAQSDL